MTKEELFEVYQTELNWISRRLEEPTLEFYKEFSDNWRHAKEVAFKMYQALRFYCTDEDVLSIDITSLNENEHVDDYDQCPCIGYILYRGQRFYAYDDDPGQQIFIVVGDRTITFASFDCPLIDWWYEADKILDGIDTL